MYNNVRLFSTVINPEGQNPSDNKCNITVLECAECLLCGIRAAYPTRELRSDEQISTANSTCTFTRADPHQLDRNICGDRGMPRLPFKVPAVHLSSPPFSFSLTPSRYIYLQRHLHIYISRQLSTHDRWFHYFSRSLSPPIYASFQQFSRTVLHSKECMSLKQY